MTTKSKGHALFVNGHEYRLADGALSGRCPAAARQGFQAGRIVGSRTPRVICGADASAGRWAS